MTTPGVILVPPVWSSLATQQAKRASSRTFRQRVHVRPLDHRMPDESLAAYARRIAWLHRTVEVGTPQPPSVSDAMGQWLASYPWDSWGTLTFRAGEFTNEAATRAWEKFARWFGALHPLGTWYVGHEVGARGRLHMHCLLGSMSPANDAERSKLWEWWFKRYGRAQVFGYDPERGAAKYIAKYCAKELAHYDLNFEGFEKCSLAKPLASGDGPTWKRRRGRLDSVTIPRASTQP
jgi:hypothetical protein